METPVTPSAILKHDILAQTEVELSQFNRLDTSINETVDQSAMKEQQTQEVKKWFMREIKMNYFNNELENCIFWPNWNYRNRLAMQKQKQEVKK